MPEAASIVLEPEHYDRMVDRVVVVLDEVFEQCRAAGVSPEEVGPSVISLIGIIESVVGAMFNDGYDHEEFKSRMAVAALMKTIGVAESMGIVTPEDIMGYNDEDS